MWGAIIGDAATANETRYANSSSFTQPFIIAHREDCLQPPKPLRSVCNHVPNIVGDELDAGHERNSLEVA